MQEYKKYENNRLSKVERYDADDKLEEYYVYEYNKIIFNHFYLFSIFPIIPNLIIFLKIITLVLGHLFLIFFNFPRFLEN